MKRDNAKAETTRRYAIVEATELTPEDLAEAMRCGQLEIEVDGAMSEWGSRLEVLLNTLEHSVNEWHEVGRSRTLLIRFSEPHSSEAETSNDTSEAEPRP